MEITRRDAVKAIAATPFVGMLPTSSLKAESEPVVQTSEPFSSSYRELALKTLKINQLKHDKTLVSQIQEMFKNTALWNIASIQPAIADYDSTLAYRIKDQKIYPTTVYTGHHCFDDRGSIINQLEQTFLTFCLYSNYMSQNVSTIDYSALNGKTVKEKYESVYIKIHEVSNNIKEGRGNFIIASPEISSLFETSVSHYTCTPNPQNLIQYVMMVNARWRLYKVNDKSMKGKMIIGHRGDSFVGSGMCFLPRYLERKNPTALRFGYTKMDPNYYSIINFTNFV